MATPFQRLDVGDVVRPGGERRADARSADFQSVGLRVVPHYSHTSVHRTHHWQGNRPGRREALHTKLVDVSKCGLGVETFGPLPLAEIVEVEGEIHSLGYCSEFRGTARVVHCLGLETGMFRSGLRFMEIEGRELACHHEEGFSVDPCLD